MGRMKSGNYDALAWVKDDLAQSLESALQSITEYIETPIDSSPLLNSISQLNQVLGTVDMLNLSGATLLTEELLTTIKHVEHTADDSGLLANDKILKGLMVLTNYVQLISPQLEDHPLQIIETVNELRQSINQIPFDSVHFLDLDFNIELPESLLDQAYKGKINGLSIDKVSHAFQLSFLSWLKDDDINGLKKVYRVIQFLHQNSTHERSKLVWTIAESFIEELISGGLLIQTRTKLLLGKLSHPIRLFTKFNETRLIEQFPESIIKEFLLYIAQSTSGSHKSIALKKLFELDFLSSRHHQQIYSFGDNALPEVKKAIVEQLQEIKANIEQLSRQTVLGSEEITSLTRQFDDIANTLELLSETKTSTILREQLEKLAQLDSTSSSYKDDLLNIANALLTVEAQLQSGLHGDDSNSPNLQEVVISECLNELIIIKDTLSQLVNSEVSDTDALSKTASHVELIASSIMMINLPEATSLLESTAQFMTHHSTDYTDLELNTCAEVISAAELYLEGIIEHGQQRSGLIKNAEKKLGITVSSVASEEPSLIYSEQIDSSSNLTALKEKSNSLTIDTLNTSPSLDLEILDEGNQFQATVRQQQNENTSSFESTTPNTDLPLEFNLDANPNLAIKNEQEDLPITTHYSAEDRAINKEIEPFEIEDKVTDTLDFHEESTLISPLTSVQRYINHKHEQSLSATLEPLGLQNLEFSTEHSQTSVQRYINNLNKHSHSVQVSDHTEPSVSLDLIEFENQTPPIKTVTSVQHYIDQLDSLEPEILDSTHGSNQAKTSVQQYIERQAEQAKDKITVMELGVSFAEGIDVEIAEIFIEEANEVLAELTELIPSWKTIHKIDDLMTIRRHFHTLKGSGRMAGANIIGELAWSVESNLNKVIEQNTAPSEQLELLIEDAFNILPDLLTRFTQGDMGSTEAAEKVTLLAHELEEGKLIPSLSEDDELQAIFNSEARQHLSLFFEALTTNSNIFILNNELLRASHSLKGCAAIAQVTPVAIIAAELDLTLRHCYEISNQLNSEQRGLLAHTIEGIQGLVNYHQGLTHEEPDIRELSAYLDKLQPTEHSSNNIDPEFLAVLIDETNELLEQFNLKLNQLKSEPANQLYQQDLISILTQLNTNIAEAHLDGLSEIYELLGLAAQHVHEHDVYVDFSLFDQGYEEINVHVESIMHNKAAPDITEFKQRVHTFISTSTVLDESLQSEEAHNEISETAAFNSQNNNVTEYETSFDIPNGDDDLLEAFTEECAELLASSGQAIKQWQNNYFDQDASMQLQRDLHTIKGGARLTDIQPIADLTHQTESLVLFAVESSTLLNNEFFNLLQRCQDAMADMQDMLSQRRPLHFSKALLTEVASFIGQSVDEIKPTSNVASIADETPPESDSDDTTVKAIPNQVEHVRVRADLLDFLTNFAGEVNISRDRVSQHNVAIHQQLGEMESTIERLQDQLRNLEIETETQILFRYDSDSALKNADFDPLELDRFSMIQQLSRGLTESVSDLHDITGSLSDLVKDSDTILLQQSRLSTGIHQGLMNTKLLPFKGLIPRLERIVRQTNSAVSKECELVVTGENQELDRTALDRIVAPIEHIIRNAIAHGIEAPEDRVANGKSSAGKIQLSIQREGSEVLMTISDDGQGINVEKIKQKALTLNLIDPDNMPSNDQLIQLILTSGFSTADDISQLSGRGVGMDVVHSEIRALKGRLSIKSLPGQGTTFIIRLPLTLSIMRSLLIATDEQQYAVPLAAVHTAERISVSDVRALLEQEGQHFFEFNQEQYQFYPLAELLDQPLILAEDPQFQLPLLLFQYGDKRIAVLVDAINSNREIVLKSAGPQLGNIGAINGATILGDGQVVFVLDIPALIEDVQKSSGEIKITTHRQIDRIHSPQDNPVALVVDDSITMRKATGNLLKRYGFDIVTAKDGIDAIAKLEEMTPDIILLDVEMPRMDGFEFATFVRNDSQNKALPIIMITSRTGEKHRQRAQNIGVNDYMGKPYQEVELVNSLQNLLGNRVELIKE